jgi:hypothetical protein
MVVRNSTTEEMAAAGLAPKSPKPPKRATIPAADERDALIEGFFDLLDHWLEKGWSEEHRRECGDCQKFERIRKELRVVWG